MFNLEASLQRVKEVLARPPTEKEMKTMATKKNAAAPASKASASAAPKAKKEADPNMITLAAVCKEIGITGQVARRKLRAAKLVRDGRWAFQKDSRELAEVRKLLTPADGEE
jgi:hypothetical protein